MNTILKKLFDRFEIKVNRQVFWYEVPSTVKTRREKDNLISDTINHLEQTIKIN